MLYEKLNDEMQEMVDHFAGRIRPLPWRRKSDLLAQAALPFADEFGGDAAQLASKGFLTAVLERLEANEVDDPHQACLFVISLNPEHREMAGRYLEAHPEVHQAMRYELEDDLPVC